MARMSVIICRGSENTKTRNSAITDKPRDAFRGQSVIYLPRGV